MKKKIAIFWFFVCTIFSLFAQSKMYVSVEENILKDKPSFFAKDCSTVYYGEEVLVLETKGKWSKIKLISDSDVFGWISSSSLTKKKIVASGSRVNVSTSELALAGKGFNAEIESEYKNQTNTNYDAVDIVEKNKVEIQSVIEFISEGNLVGENEN